MPAARNKDLRPIEIAMEIATQRSITVRWIMRRFRCSRATAYRYAFAYCIVHDIPTPGDRDAGRHAKRGVSALDAVYAKTDAWPGAEANTLPRVSLPALGVVLAPLL